MDNKEMEKVNAEELDQAAGGWTMGYDPRIMDCPHCGHHMLKRTGKDKEFVYYKCDFCGKTTGEYKWSTD